MGDFLFAESDCPGLGFHARCGKRHKRFFVGDFKFAKSDCPGRFRQSIKTRNRRRTHRQTHTHVVIIYRIVTDFAHGGSNMVHTDDHIGIFLISLWYLSIYLYHSWHFKDVIITSGECGFSHTKSRRS